MLFKQSRQRVSTGQLNRILKDALQRTPPPLFQNRRPKIYYGTQVGVQPPTIVLFVNNPDWVSDSYQRFIINRFRELLPYPEDPIRLILRARGKGKVLADLAVDSD